MRMTKVRKFLILLAVSLLIVGLFIQFGMAGKGEKEEAVVVEEVVVTGPFSSATRAVDEAKKYSGTTLNVVWEAGLQSQDPKTMGPKWEDMTGIKIKVIELSYNDIYSNQLQDHLTGGSSYDVITFSPLWLIDFVNAGVVEPLNSYINKYMNKADLDDFLDVYKSEGYARIGDTWYGLPDDGDVFVLYYRKDLFEDEGNIADFRAEYGYILLHLKPGISSMISATSLLTSLPLTCTAVQCNASKDRRIHSGWAPLVETADSSSTRIR